MTQRLDFIDVSHWQGKIDFTQLEKQGVLGVIAKATEGTTVVDKQFVRNRNESFAAELVFASYHYLRTGSIEAQMDHYLRIADPEEGERVVLDFEEEKNGKVTIPDLIQAVDTLRHIRDDLQITVYGASFLTDSINAYKGDLSPLEGTSLWAARYSSSQPVVATKVWPTYSAWQYSDKGKLKGISEAVDLNTFNGSRDNCLKWFGPYHEGDPIVPPVAPPADTVITISIDTPDGVDIHLVVNGELVPV